LAQAIFAQIQTFSSPPSPSSRGALAMGLDKGLLVGHFCMCFPSGHTEDAFATSRRDRLARMIMLVTACFVILLSAALFSVRPWSEVYRTSEAAVRLNFVRTGTDAIMMSLSGLCFIIAKLPSSRERLGTKGLEVMTVSYASICLLAVPLSMRPYVCRLLGHEPEEVLNDSFPASDTIFLLNLDIIITAMNLALPVRWVMLWPFELTSCCIYIFCSAKLGNSQEQLVVLVPGFLMLVFCACTGKRMFEKHERATFLALLDEKQKRFYAEFMLSRSTESKEPSDTDGMASSVTPSKHQGSLVSTTMTGRAFDIVDQDLPFSFEQIRAIGLREQWLLSPCEIRLRPDQTLGSGGFGVVIRGEYSGCQVAVKVSRLAMPQQSSDSQLSQLCNELRLLRRLRHPNIVVLYGACLDSQHADVALIMELLHGQTLSRFLSDEQPTSLVRVRLLADISAAVAFLHSRQPPIVHGDLKGANIFVESDARAKLLDFGLSRFVTKHARPGGGTVHWMPPEMILEGCQAPTTSADVFSFGRVVFFVVTGIYPHSGLSESRLLRVVRQDRAPLPLNWPHTIWSILGPSYRPVVDSCCHEHPAQRPGIREVQRLLLEAAREALGECLVPADDPAPDGDLHMLFERARRAAASAEGSSQAEGSGCGRLGMKAVETLAEGGGNAAHQNTAMPEDVSDFGDRMSFVLSISDGSDASADEAMFTSF